MDITSQREKAPWLRSLPSRLLGQTAALVSRESEKVLAELGSHRHQVAVLATLEAFGPASQAELCRRTDLDRSDMNAVLNGLEDQGHVSRSVNPESRRENIVALSRTGAKRFAELRKAVERAQTRIFASLSEDELAELVTMLGVLHDDLASDG